MSLEELIDRIEERFREIRHTPDVLQKDLIHEMAKASVVDTLDWIQAKQEEQDGEVRAG